MDNTFKKIIFFFGFLVLLSVPVMPTGKNSHITKIHVICGQNIINYFETEYKQIRVYI